MICVRSFVEAISNTNSTSEHNNMSVSGKRVAGDGGGGRGGGIDPSSALWPVVLLEDHITHALTNALRHLAGSWHSASATSSSPSSPSSPPVPPNTPPSIAPHPLIRPPAGGRHPLSLPWTQTQSEPSVTTSGGTLPEYSLNQVAEHSSPLDCWIVIYDKIYDVTNFLQEHPGGEFIILEFAGRDATLAFRGTRHGADSYELLNKYLIGILPKSERIYKNRSASNSTFDSDAEPNPSC